MSEPVCVKNYRLIGFDVLSGLSVLVEYDILLAPESGMVYGIEETQGQKCNLLFDKAIQALAGSIILPWIPYRVSNEIVHKASQCSHIVKAAVNIVLPNNNYYNECYDARLLDALYGELAMLAKLLSIMPGEGTLFTQLAKVAAANTLDFIDNEGHETWIYKLITEIDNDIKTNLSKIKELILKIMNLQNIKDLEKYISDISRAGEQLDLLKRFATQCNKKITIIILVPKIYVTHSLKEMIKILEEELNKYKITIENLILLGYDNSTLNTVQIELRNRLKQKTVQTRVISSELSESTIENIINNSVKGGCILVVTLLDFGKEDMKTLISKLEEKKMNNKIKDYLLAWGLYRIRYEQGSHATARLRTKPVIAFYTI